MIAALLRRLLPVLGLASGVLLPVAAAQTLEPRVPLEPGPVLAVPIPPGFAVPAGRRLIVKFQDDLRVRALPDGGLTTRTGADLFAVDAVVQGDRLGFSPLIRVAESRLADLERRAASLSGRGQPDLAGMLVVEVPDAEGVDRDEQFVRVGERLRSLDEVEFVYLQTPGAPPPGDIAPVTPDLTGSQGYFAPDPGMDVDAAWLQEYRGSGIRIADCEYGWNPAHEDLMDISLNLETGQTIHPDVFTMGWDCHGTAVLGVVAGVENPYGVTGIATDATVSTYPEWSVEEGFRRLTAITNAIADSALGDIVVLEMQTLGAGGGLAPAEVDPSVFAVVKAGVDAGVVVVAAAGNGSQDLDGAAYFDYRNMGDSGAILVGAGSPDANHDALGFSTFGSRIDVQGWGDQVFTLGYGDFTAYGGDKNQRYTDVFDGTSAATSLVGAACAVLQQAAVELGGARLPSRDIRLLLADTGTPQGTGGNVGPHPDLAAAILKLPDFFLPRWQDVGGGTTGVNGPPLLIGTGDLTPNSDLGLSLTNGPPLALAIVWASSASAPASFLGGTLHAFPFFTQIIVATDASGAVSGTTPYPEGHPSGTQLWFQIGMVDATVPIHGASLSNGVKSTTP